VHFINANTGTAVGRTSLLRTTNGGASWNQQTSGTTSYLNGVCFTDANTGTVVGYDGTILRTTNGGVTFINQISSNIPERFWLSQNYPNPFNPVTKIKFDIIQHTPYPLSRGENVILKVFDITGKEIATLVNEQLQPGNYEITFDGSNIPSGVYFYQLNSGNYRATKKLMLLK
jgi:hypothetical protein